MKAALLSFLYSLLLHGAVHGDQVPLASPLQDNNPPDKRVAIIVIVDSAKRMLTLKAKGTEYVFYVDSHLIDTRTHQSVAFEKLSAGQLISFISRPRFDGELEIVSLVVLPNGPASGPGGGSRGGSLEVSPFR